MALPSGDVRGRGPARHHGLVVRARARKSAQRPFAASSHAPSEVATGRAVVIHTLTPVTPLAALAA